MRDWLENLGKSITSMFLSGKRKVRLRELCNRAGFKEIPYGTLGRVLLFTVFLTVAWYLYLVGIMQLFADRPILFIVAGFVVFFFVSELLLLIITFVTLTLVFEVKIYNRVQTIESNLPLFLREFSTNLKAGREFVDALEDSLTPELGPLNDDVSAMVVEIRSGKMAPKVLKEYSERYDSYIINETFEIILDAYEGGGGLAEIIDRIAENLEVLQYLRKNAIASVSNYIIFTSIVALFIAPLLFALSYNLLHLIQGLLDKVALSGDAGSLPVSIASFNISFPDFMLFSQLAVATISGCAAAIIGVIRSGRMKGAIPLIVFFVMISLAVHYLSVMFLTKLFEILQLTY
jgi:archaellum biogenesis protein FlaJ (TadC family)